MKKASWQACISRLHFVSQCILIQPQQPFDLSLRGFGYFQPSRAILFPCFWKSQPDTSSSSFIIIMPWYFRFLLRELFDFLGEKWKADTGHQSSRLFIIQSRRKTLHETAFKWLQENIYLLASHCLLSCSQWGHSSVWISALTMWFAHKKENIFIRIPWTDKPGLFLLHKLNLWPVF